MICLIKYFCWKKRVVSQWLFRFIQSLQSQNKSGKIKWCFSNFCSATVLFFLFPIPVDWNRSKSIKISHNQTELIITRNFVIDFYGFPIFVDLLVSTKIHNHQILLTIGIIDMLRPVYIRSYWTCVNTFWLNKFYASNTDISFGILCNIPSLSYVFSLHMHAP